MVRSTEYITLKKSQKDRHSRDNRKLTRPSKGKLNAQGVHFKHVDGVQAEFKERVLLENTPFQGEGYTKSTYETGYKARSALDMSQMLDRMFMENSWVLVDN